MGRVSRAGSGGSGVLRVLEVLGVLGVPEFQGFEVPKGNVVGGNLEKNSGRNFGFFSNTHFPKKEPS